MSLDFKYAWTATADTRAALGEMRARIAQPAPSCVFFYCSPKHDLEELARCIGDSYDCPVLACTTAGEIVPGHGYVEEGLAAASLGSPQMKVAQEAIPDVRNLDGAAALQIKTRLLQCLGDRCGPGETRFGLLLIDGLCQREEFVAATLHSALGEIPLIGGSAGETGRLVETRVLANGQFRTHAAVLTLVQTSLPCMLFKTDHFKKSGTRFVVTRAEPEKRRLLELDGIPPVDFYTEQTGISRAEFNATTAASAPLLLPVGSEHYVRSIRSAEPDGSLSMFCAIEEGMVMRLGEPLDIVAETDRQRRAIQAAVPNHTVTLGFDCVLRRVEACHRDSFAAMREVVDRMKLFGFSTYGEQYNGLHVNQTLTGVALGSHS
jgi:hypothetical protein